MGDLVEARIAALLDARSRIQGARPHATLRAGRTWYRIVDYGTDSGTAEIMLYDEIGYWGVTAAEFVDELRNIHASEIRLRINSPGGDVFDGLAIYNALRAHPARVTTFVEGLAASAASFIAQAGAEVVVARNAMMMIHRASGMCFGNAENMRALAALLDQIDANLADIYAQHAGGEAADWLDRMTAETWYTGAEAVAAGLADRMTDPDPTPPADAGDSDPMARTWDLRWFRYAGRAAAPPPVPVDRTTPAGAPLVDLDAFAELVAARIAATGTAAEPAGGEPDPDPADADESTDGPDDAGPDPAADATTPAADDPERDDDWAAAVAALTTPDPWAAAAAALTDPSTVDGDPLARLREAHT